MAMEPTTMMIVLPIREIDIERNLREVVYPGIFLMGRAGPISAGRFVFEGKVWDRKFSIRRITSCKWLFPMVNGSWDVANGDISITMEVDKRHIIQLQVVVYSLIGFISLAIGLALIFGREDGVDLLSSYLIPSGLMTASYLFVLLIKSISRARLKNDCNYLKKVFNR